MTKTVDKKQIKSYLLAEMTQGEKEAFEEAIFFNDEMFYEVTETENDLIDQYAAGKLTGDELQKFEKSLKEFPGRKGKIANAIALKQLINDESPSESVSPSVEIEQMTFREKIFGLFNVPTFAYAVSVLLLLMTAFSGLLYLDSQQKGAELTRIQNEAKREGGLEKELEKQLDEAKVRETELQKKIDGEREATGDLTEELVRERESRRVLQKNLEYVRRQNNLPDAIKTPKPPVPRIASIRLTPGRIDRNGGSLTTTSVGNQTSRVAVSLTLPDGTKKEERFSLTLNDKPFLQNVAPRTSASGKKSISLTIRTANLPAGKNKLTVIGKDGKEVTRYVFQVDKQ